ncbi:MAG: glutamate synthase [Actinomycetota bacterium]|nr:glutamate synthase [Actinomycetota bacterium]
MIRAGDRPLRELNAEIRAAVGAGKHIHVTEPLSRHNLGVALPAGGAVTFDGSVGYYCGGLNNGATITVTRNAGWGIAEAMASGHVTVDGNAAMSVGASIRGGTIHVRGNAGPRCGVAMKGGMIVVEGSVGHACGFMAHGGRVICLGDTADAAGDSLWTGEIWVAGTIRGLGVDARIEEPPTEDVAEVQEVLAGLGIGEQGQAWKRIVSAQALWHFESRDARQWLMI